MTYDELGAEIRRFGPWHHDVEIAPGVRTGDPRWRGETDPVLGTPSVVDPLANLQRTVRDLFPDGMKGRSFLDCACNAGGYLFAARRLGAGPCFGFDVREHWIRQAHFLARHLPAEDIDAGICALADVPGLGLKPYDVTLFSGILYHLPDPVAGLKIAADLTREIIIVNTATFPAKPDGLVLNQESRTLPMSGVDGLAWYPTGETVVRQMLAWCGFPPCPVAVRPCHGGRARQDRAMGRARRDGVRSLRPEPSPSACAGPPTPIDPAAARSQIGQKAGRDATMQDKFRIFAALHVPGDPVILYNAWDAGSAKAVANAGAKAIATGSWSVAAAQAYGDGEGLPLEIALAGATRIAGAVDLPVSIDFEGGYAVEPADVGANARRLAATGAIGCNFEDQVVGGDGLHPIPFQAARIAAMRAATGAPFFINARTDIFLQNGPESHDKAKAMAAIERGKAYADAGANSFFVPGLIDLKLLERICREVPLPVNFMAFPGAPGTREVAGVGVARISHGPNPYRTAMAALTAAAQAAFDWNQPAATPPARPRPQPRRAPGSRTRPRPGR